MTETLQAVEKLLPSLTPSELAQLRRWIDSADAAVGIESTLEVCGGDACIAGTRIPVWVLEQARRLGHTEQEILLDYPTLRAEDLVNAWAYVRSHGAEIEADIAANQDEDDQPL